MGDVPLNEQVKAALQQIINERDYLRKELALAKQSILELEFQNIELYRMLTNAHKQLYLHDPTRISTVSSPKSWIGTWQTSPEEFPALTGVENTWRNGHLQRALSQMPQMLERKDFGHRHRVNARLLYSALIQTSGGNYHAALHYAEEGLRIASEFKLHELAGKAQFHRGLCYLYLSEPAKAKWCFILASHLQDHAQTIEECQTKTENQIHGLPLSDPKRSIGTDFKFFCHSETDKYVYQEASVYKNVVYA